MFRIRTITALLALLILIGGCDPQAPQGASTGSPVGELALVGSFDWSLPERFGLDANDDGRIDIPNTQEYVLNLEPGDCASGCEGIVPRFTVVLDASAISLVDRAGDPQPIDGFRWTVLDGDAVIATESIDSSQAIVQLPEGTYEVRLEVTRGEATWSLERSVRVEDVVVVSLGDSYAAGEGNPEVPGDPPLWADAGASPAASQAIDHELAHRSGLAGPAQAALAIERADPRSSVTFVFLAASGASIEEGMLEESDTKRASDGTRSTLRPQVEELIELMGCVPDATATCLRTIDVLHMSAGGNDIGFSFTLGSLIALDPVLVVSPIYENLRDNLLSDVENEIAQLPSLFEPLADALGAVDASQVYLTAYPGSGKYLAGDQILTCDEVGEDLLPGLEVDREELDAVEERLLVPLNTALATIADRYGWVFVDEHVAAFEGHGYCGSDPYATTPYAGNPFPELLTAHPEPGVRWFRRAAESAVFQGGGGLFQPERLSTSGTLHPNEYGHLAYAEAILRAVGY